MSTNTPPTPADLLADLAGLPSTADGCPDGSIVGNAVRRRDELAADLAAKRTRREELDQRLRDAQRRIRLADENADMTAVAIDMANERIVSYQLELAIVALSKSETEHHGAVTAVKQYWAKVDSLKRQLRELAKDATPDTMNAYRAALTRTYPRQPTTLEQLRDLVCVPATSTSAAAD